MAAVLSDIHSISRPDIQTPLQQHTADGFVFPKAAQAKAVIRTPLPFRAVPSARFRTQSRNRARPSPATSASTCRARTLHTV